MAVLSVLPNEILSIITAHLEHARDVAHLASTNRRLSQFVKLDGWKVFIRARFNVGEELEGDDADPRETAHGLATLCRNWDRKAFIARYLQPPAKVIHLNCHHVVDYAVPTGQTMGFQPIIDSFEHVQGAWNNRLEVLAYSAGTQVVVRYKESRNTAKPQWEDAEVGRDTDGPQEFDSLGNRVTWHTFQSLGNVEGVDDIVGLKLVQPQHHIELEDALIYATATGELTMVGWDTKKRYSIIQQYDTRRCAISKNISVWHAEYPWMTAILRRAVSDYVALYPVGFDPNGDDIQSVTGIMPDIRGRQNGRIWSCDFISQDKVALTSGPSFEPIQVWQIREGGFSETPLRSFDLDPKLWLGTRIPTYMRRTSSATPILAVPPTAQAGSEAGHTFFSGGQDGIIRLHDLRSPRTFESSYWDQTNDSSIYSLAAHGNERIVAGVSMHSMIKVFDLRISGSHGYETKTLSARPQQKARAKQAMMPLNENVEDDVPVDSSGWNLYLRPGLQRGRGEYPRRSRRDGPVYSLSIPSQYSSCLYAGLEGNVQSLDFHAIADPYPDRLHSQSISRYLDSGAVNARSSFDRKGDALNLSMYEQSNPDGWAMQLLVQRDVTTSVIRNKNRNEFAQSKGLDERWLDFREVNLVELAMSAQNRGRGRGRERGRGGRGWGRGSG